MDTSAAGASPAEVGSKPQAAELVGGLTAAHRPTPWRMALALFICCAVVFIIFRTANFNADMPWQASVAEGRLAVTYPPDHLIYPAVVRGIWTAWHAVGLPGRAHLALQTTNALLGGVIVAMVFLLVFRVTGRKPLALFAALFYALTPYVWLWATDVETIASSMAFQVTAIYLLFLLSEGGSRRRQYGLAVAAGVCHAVAAHFQYLHVMLVPAALVAAMFAARSERLTARLKVAALYLVTVGVLVWGPFLFVATQVDGISTPSGLLKWLLSPGNETPGFAAKMGVLKTPVQFASSFAGALTPLNLPAHEAKLVMMGQGSLKAYLVENWWRVPIVAALALLQLVLIWRLLCSCRKRWPDLQRPVLIAAAIMMFYTLWGMYWASSWLGFGAPAFILLMAVSYSELLRPDTADRAARWLRTATPVVLAVVAVAGLAIVYLPAHRLSNNVDLTETLAVSAKIGTNDILLTPGSDRMTDYWDYFAPLDKKLVRLRPPKGEGDRTAEMLREADAAITATLSAGGRVYVHRLYAEEDDYTRPWNEFLLHGIKRQAVIEHFRKIPHREAFTFDDHQYWEITAPPQAEK